MPEKKIHKLPDTLIAQIAAGEVIENPSGVLKELLENSIDAGASEIEIFIKGAGFESIQVRDNGSGIPKEDLRLAVENFATSKIDALDDLFKISSFGFRGEALGSIRSVSKLTLESKYTKSDTAYKILGEADYISNIEPCALPKGTRILVEDLFFNAPVRREFSKNERKIKKSFIELLTNYAIAYPEVSFEYAYENDKKIFFYKKETLSARIEDIFSNDFYRDLTPVYNEFNAGSLEGFVSKLGSYKSSASHMYFFINKRAVKYSKLVGLFKRAYGEMLPPGRFPAAFLFLELRPDEVDVNVHPQKREVRFKNENEVLEFLFKSIRRSVESDGPIPMRNIYTPRRKTEATKTNEDKKIDISIPFLLREKDSQTENTSAEYLKKEHQLNGQSEFSETLFAETDKTIFLPQTAHSVLFDTFLLASSEKGVYLIDQHTAHERINYEKFIKKLNAKADVSQKLLTPVALHLSPAEKALLGEYQIFFEQLGFELEDLGPAGFQILQVPFYVKTGEEEKAFFLALKLIEEDGRASAIELFDHIAKSLACRQAIKKGDQESSANLKDLLEELSRCENPRRCPHGRPTMVYLSKEDIFTLFKRKA
ncbi:MAG: DNA mismatch repair endonuclease MutL [Spirochaetia bacterium]|nr:DNA mismatch repair endonuclease MutL [Spirochaetia bacterium]